MKRITAIAACLLASLAAVGTATSKGEQRAEKLEAGLGLRPTYISP
jgi:hypothetical protein